MQPVEEDHPSTLIIFSGIIMGFFVRMYVPYHADFPINDGGLFYVMIKDILGSHFALPAWTTYNNLKIPFVYPPLPFYLGAIVSHFLSIPILDVLRIFPPFVSGLNVIAFYLLSRSIFKNGFLAAWALFAYAVYPAGFIWHIMGGGLTRSIGLLFGLLALRQSCAMYQDYKVRHTILTGVFLGLTVLCHLGMATFAALSLMIFFLFFGRNSQGFKATLFAAIVSFLFTLPWWIAIIRLHGFNPILSALISSHDQFFLDSIARLVLPTFTGESVITILTVTGLMGIFACLLKRDYFLIVWFLILFFLIPRTSPEHSAIPFSMLIAVGINDFIVSPAKNITAKLQNLTGLKRVRIYAGIFCFYILLICGLSAAFTPLRLLGVDEYDRQAMLWVRNNTHLNDRFMVINASANSWAEDAIAEWFPALSERFSIITVQGAEWLDNNGFKQRLQEWKKLHDSITNETHKTNPIEEMIQDHISGLDYIYLSASKAPNAKKNYFYEAMSLRLLRSGYYSCVFNNNGVSIFKKITSQLH